MRNRRRLIIELMNSKFRLVNIKRGMFFRRKATINTADSNDLSANKVIETPLEAPIISVPAVTAKSARATKIRLGARANTAGITEVSATRTTSMSHSLGLIAYIIGQLRLNRKVSMSSSAGCAHKDSTDVTASKEAHNVIVANANVSRSANCNINEVNANEVNAVMLSANTVHASAFKDNTTECLAILCCWNYPTLIDGVLSISQAHTINYENEILEVI